MWWLRYWAILTLMYRWWFCRLHVLPVCHLEEQICHRSSDNDASCGITTAPSLKNKRQRSYIDYQRTNVFISKYLSDLPLIKKSSQLLRSFSQILLQVLVSKLQCYDDCTFCVAGSSLWNGLPERAKSARSLGSCKSILKTHLLKIVYQGLYYFHYIFRHKRFYCITPLNGFSKYIVLLLWLLITLKPEDNWHDVSPSSEVAIADIGISDEKQHAAVGNE